MFCSKCGSKANEGAAFCHACGTQLSNNATDTQMPMNPVVYPQEDTAVATKKKTSKKAIALVICGIVAVVIVGILFSSGGGRTAGAGKSTMIGSKVQCSPCNGRGYSDCPRCGDSGQLYDTKNDRWVNCTTCGGSGKSRCTYCNGTGWR